MGVAGKVAGLAAQSGESVRERKRAAVFAGFRQEADPDPDWRMWRE